VTAACPHDCPDAFVFAQQHSSATFLGMHFHSRKKKYITFKKVFLFGFFIY